MSDRTEAGFNLVLLVVLSGLGVVEHGVIYLLYIAAAVLVYYVVSGFVRTRAPGRALTSGLGCAWGSLSIINGVLRGTPVSIVIGAMAFVIWVGPHLIGGWRAR